MFYTSRMLLDRYEVCETACKKARKMVNLEQTSLCKQKVQYGTYCTEAFDAASGGLDRGQARGHCFALPPHSAQLSCQGSIKVHTDRVCLIKTLVSFDTFLARCLIVYVHHRTFTIFQKYTCSHEEYSLL